jgi:hypothetical protein
VASCLGILWLLPSGALAKGKEDQDTRAKAAKKACLLGDVEKGADILADLYVETNDPTFIYNQGRCFEQNGKNDQAVLRFKEYQRKAQGLSPADVDALRKKIEDLEATSAQRPSPPPPVIPAAPPPTVPASTATVPAAVEPHAQDALGITRAEPPPEPEPAPPVYKRWWFWTGIGAVVAGGVVTGVLLTRKSAPSSPLCDGVGTCVP